MEDKYRYGLCRRDLGEKLVSSVGDVSLATTHLKEDMIPDRGTDQATD